MNEDQPADVETGDGFGVWRHMIALPHPLTSTAPYPLGSLDDATTLPFVDAWDVLTIRRAREAAALPRPNRAERRRRARATRSR